MLLTKRSFKYRVREKDLDPWKELTDPELMEICERDDVEEFKWITNWKRMLYNYGSNPLQVLQKTMTAHATKCAEALLSGKTKVEGVVDFINSPFHPNTTAMYPIHLAALRFYAPCIMELLLHYGARTNVPFVPSAADCKRGRRPFTHMLPLQMAITDLTLSRETYFPGWTLRHRHHSVYTLIVFLCLPSIQNVLETIGLLAAKTHDAEEIFVQYAKKLMIIECATLLMVDHTRFLNVVDNVWRHFDSLSCDPSEEIDAVRHLVDVFATAGDTISSYIKQDKFLVRDFHAVKYVQNVLEENGFHHPSLDAEFSIFDWYHCDDTTLVKGLPPIVQRCLCDFGMSHYSKSGSRWKASIKDPWLRFLRPEDYINDLRNEIEDLKGETNNIKEKQESCYGRTEVALHLRPCFKIQIDDKLKIILEKDDVEQFVSVIRCNVDRFSSGKLLCDVCVTGAIKCAEALLTGKTPLAVDVDMCCHETGLYPLHFAALSMLPSMTELFLYHGFRSKISTEPQNLLDVLPANLVENSTGKLPLHMALLQICCCPYTREWSPDHSIHKLLTIFCLPRMQNSLETLGLLVQSTKNIEHEFIRLVKERKIVELAALLMVGDEELDAIAHSTDVNLEHEEKRISNKVQRKTIKSENSIVHALFHVFAYAGKFIKAYIKEDKYDVSKHQTMKDVACMIQCVGLHLKASDTDLSIYNWFCDEEPTYPREAPFENTRVSHDFGMAHYAKTRCRWKVLKKDLSTWRQAHVEAYICELDQRLEGRGKGKLQNAGVQDKTTLVGMSKKRPRRTLGHSHGLVSCGTKSADKSSVQEEEQDVDLV